jgi:hypothetical protein
MPEASTTVTADGDDALADGLTVAAGVGPPSTPVPHAAYYRGFP